MSAHTLAPQTQAAATPATVIFAPQFMERSPHFYRLAARTCNEAQLRAWLRVAADDIEQLHNEAAGITGPASSVSNWPQGG